MAPPFSRQIWAYHVKGTFALPLCVAALPCMRRTQVSRAPMATGSPGYGCQWHQKPFLVHAGPILLHLLHHHAMTLGSQTPGRACDMT